MLAPPLITRSALAPSPPTPQGIVGHPTPCRSSPPAPSSGMSRRQSRSAGGRPPPARPARGPARRGEARRGARRRGVAYICTRRCIHLSAWPRDKAPRGRPRSRVSVSLAYWASSFLLNPRFLRCTSPSAPQVHCSVLRMHSSAPRMPSLLTRVAPTDQPMDP